MKANKYLLISLMVVTQAQAFDLPRQPVKAYECDVCSKLSHENLQDKWEITAQPLNRKISNRQKSYSYREEVTAEQLHAGVVLPTLAPGAVMRITPLQDRALPNLILKTPDNQVLSLQQASVLYSEDEAFGDKSITTKHQTMIQIKPELGFGNFTLKSKKSNAKPKQHYLISVFDKFSTSYLQVETDSVHYQFGDKLTATITLKDDDTNYTSDKVEATLVSPTGEMTPIELTKINHNQYEGTASLSSGVNDHGENWYIEASVSANYGDHFLRRSGHTAFSYAVPSASLLNVKKISTKPLTFVATLDIATASRYALQSVLFRKNGGEAKPIETSQKAQWLETGRQVIQFTFDNSSQFADDMLYLGYLRLIDYGQLKTVYQYNQPIKLSKLVD